MKQQVTFLISGPAHIPYLVASLHTLRKHWDGAVAVHCWPESKGIVSRIAADDRLDIGYAVREPKLRKTDGVGGNSQFLDKIDMTMGLDCDVSLYLDADTTVHGDIKPLFGAGGQFGFCATQWNDWVTTGKMVAKRVKALLDVEEIPNKLITDTITNTRPSVNGGVWAAQPGSPVLPRWYEWTLACKKIFISDERVLHLMENAFSPMEFIIACDLGKWNSSPMHQCRSLKDENVVVRHYHGDSNVRPDKSKRGFDLWWPIWMHCQKNNLGGCQEWGESIENKWMNKLGTE